ncbi:TatD family hydrolase [Candidatus Similichlamydia epinepheli]|uniref:TatD family hydrolase n=1 Tax=Candidatus Similichlamydia epinepheli TaxID=1903953 RepID=UPI000D36AFBC|nr:TatD family hydrolase [Candidatus Similichlamydia epinepheli]
MNLIDTHIHWADDKLWPAHSRVKEAILHGVTSMINICLSSSDLERGVELQKCYPSEIKLAAALHPAEVYRKDNVFWEEVVQKAKSGMLHAIGETGIDLFHKSVTLEEQQRRFLLHMELAIETDLPIIVHSRNALAHVLEMLDRHYLNHTKSRPGVVHCFSGGKNECKEIIKRGWLIGIGGCVTFKKSTELRECMKEVDSSSYVLETDAPYLSPEPNRKRTNESKFLPEIAHFLANLRGEPVEKIVEDTSRNATALFDLGNLPKGS